MDHMARKENMFRTHFALMNSDHKKGDRVNKLWPIERIDKGERKVKPIKLNIAEIQKAHKNFKPK